MNFFYSVTVILCVHYVVSAPVDHEKSLYDAITERCPTVSTIPNYKNFPLFNSCKEWKSIEMVDKLTTDNAGKVRCLLYFATFTQYCTNNTVKLNVTIPKDVFISYNKKTVCDYMKTFNSSLGKMFANEDNCQKICIDEMGLVNSICSISYYFAHLKPNVSEESKFQRPPQLLTPDNAGNTNLQGTIQRENILNSSVANKTGISNLGQSESKFIGDRPSILIPDSGKNTLQNNIADTESVTSDPAEANQVDNEGTNQQHISSPNLKDTQIGTNDEHETQNSKTETNVKVEDINVKTIEETDKKKVDKENEVAMKDNQETQQNAADENPQVVGPNIEDGDDENDVHLQENDDEPVESPASVGVEEKASKPLRTDESDPVNYDTEMQGDSYFFTYFMILCIIFIVGYVCYHNKQKILALILEGRKGKRQYRSRRPNSANYHKLDSNLEEAINSSCKKNTNNVIY